MVIVAVVVVAAVLVVIVVSSQRNVTFLGEQEQSSLPACLPA